MPGDELPPALAKFLKDVNTLKCDDATEILIGLLKRREIKSSRHVAKAVAKLLLRFVSQNKHTKLSESLGLIRDVRDLGRLLVAAQPHEHVIGNIVRRVLGIIREECNDQPTLPSFADIGGRYSRASSIGDNDSADYGSNPGSGTATPHSGRPYSRDGDEEDIDAYSRRKSKAFVPPNVRNWNRSGSVQLSNPNFAENNLQHALFSLLMNNVPLPSDSPSLKPEGKEALEDKDIRGDVIEGIRELMDELDMVDEQVAAHSETHIHHNEIVLVFGSSVTLQAFLLKAALKRKFTVIMIESYPNDYQDVQEMLKAPSSTGVSAAAKQSGKAGSGKDDQTAPQTEMKATLTAVGIECILLPLSAVAAAMSRVNKVLMGSHVILRNGSMITHAGARLVARCAQEHAIPVVVVSGVYKLSPRYPFDPDSMLEVGNSSLLVPWEDGELVGKAEIFNPTMDFLPGELIDHYITNVGGYTPSNLYKLVEEQYGTVIDNLE